MVAFNYNAGEKVITAVFTGRMDSVAAMKLADIIQNEQVINERKSEEKIVFDLKDVDYIASSFIRICVTQAKQAGKGNFSIVNCQPFVKKTFKISGLDEALNIRE